MYFIAHLLLLNKLMGLTYLKLIEIIDKEISLDNYFNPALETGQFRHKKTPYLRAGNSL